MIYIYLFLAGGLGVLARFISVKTITNIFGSSFPYGTLTVNIVGSLFFGFLSWYIVQRLPVSMSTETIKTVVLTGLLGGFTTFSAFSMEMLQMLQSGQLVKSLIYMMLSVCVCVFACFIGLLMAKQLV